MNIAHRDLKPENLLYTKPGKVKQLLATWVQVKLLLNNCLLLINTLRTGDANLRFLRFCITTVKDEWRKSAFLTRAQFPRTSLHNTWSVSPNGPLGWMFKETWPHSELMIYDKYRGKKYPS
jgi:serine/threonine protein kinase